MRLSRSAWRTAASSQPRGTRRWSGLRSHRHGRICHLDAGVSSAFKPLPSSLPLWLRASVAPIGRRASPLRSG